MFHPYPPLSVLEKRIPDLLILLFLLSWSLETGMTLMCLLSFGAACPLLLFPLHLMTRQTPLFPW